MELGELINRGKTSKVFEALNACPKWWLELEKKYQGRPPLHHAVRAGDPELVQKLLSVGAKVNSRDKDDSTPIIAVNTVKECVEIIPILLAAGASIN